MSKLLNKQDLQQKRFLVESLIEQKLDRITFSQEIIHLLEDELQILFKEQQEINERLKMCVGM